jgi:hypothetical protein
MTENCSVTTSNSYITLVIMLDLWVSFPENWEKKMIVWIKNNIFLDFHMHRIHFQYNRAKYLLLASEALPFSS